MTGGVSGTNERYGQAGPDGDYAAYSHNCQRCSFALEMRLRGYDVEATEFLGRGDIVSAWWQKAFDGMNYEGIGATRKSNIVSRLQDKMLSDYGPNTRAIVYMAWDGGSAHVFNVGLDASGKLWSADGQTGKHDVLADYAKSAKPGKVLVARVDNLNPSDVYLKGAIRKKR